MLKTGSVQVHERTGLNVRVLLKILLTVLVSYLLANSTISGTQSSLIASFVSVIDVTSGIFGFVGAMIAYFFSGKTMVSVVPILSMLIIIIFKIVVTEIFSKKLKSVGSALLAGITYSLSGIVVVFFTTTSGSAAFLSVCQGILCGCAAYFLNVATESYKNEKKLVLTGLNGASVAAVFVLIIAVMCTISFSIINVGRILAFIVILISAKRFKHVGGAISGVLSTFGMAMFSSSFGKASLLVAAAGMLAGVFSEFGSIMISIFFVGANAIGLIVSGITPDTAKVLVDAVIASAAFIIIPDRLYNGLIGATSVCESDSTISKIAASRLEFAAHTIADVKSSIEQISSALEKKTANSDMPTMVCDEICSSCKNNMYCWEMDFDKTYEQFKTLSNIVESKKYLTIEDIPQGMSGCFKKSAIVESFNSSYAQKNQDNYAMSKFKDMRGILFEQFGAMEDMLNEISSEISSGKQLDQNLSKEVTEFFQDFGAISPKACVFYDRFDHMYIEAFYSGTLELTKEELALELFDITDRDIDIPEISVIKGNSKLCAMEKTAYKLEINAIQKSAIDGDPSGDTCEYFYDGQGNAYFIMSDGMGTGKFAAVNSMLTVNLLIRLLKAGIGYDATVKLINSSVMAKSKDESFATVDIACINLYTGRLELLKLGASVTFVKSENKIFNIQTVAMPLGILHEPYIDKKGVILKENDMVVMASDGLNESVYPLIKNQMLTNSDLEPSKLSESILKSANEINDGQKRDDLSIITFKLAKNNK